MSYRWDAASAAWIGTADPGMPADITSLVNALSVPFGSQGLVEVQNGVTTFTLWRDAMSIGPLFGSAFGGLSLPAFSITMPLASQFNLPTLLLGASFTTPPIPTAFGAAPTTPATPPVEGRSYAGGAGDDVVQAGPTIALAADADDTLTGGAGNDTLLPGAGDDLLIGGDGFDLIDWSTARATDLVFRPLPTVAGEPRLSLHSVASGATQGIETLASVEAVLTADGLITFGADGSGLFRVLTIATGESFLQTGSAYSGPVAYLQRQIFGSSAGEIFIGTGLNDLVNAFGGDDAIDAGAGSDVIDGGGGSNFISGGSGLDVFFLDGRNLLPSWSTITDWQGSEQLSLWGFTPGVSRLTWLPSDGAPGWKGVTLHVDLNADGIIDASVTWTGIAQAQLPTPLEFPGLLWFL